VLFHRKPHTDALRMWTKKLIERKPFKLVAVALANKMARIAFAILRGKTVYREIPAQGAPAGSRPSLINGQGGIGVEGDQEVMRRKRIDPEARGVVCAPSALP
jgi:hypothetical protein